MHFKLLIVFVEDDKTDAVLAAARDAGATGTTVINNARVDGLEKSKTVFVSQMYYLSSSVLQRISH